MKHLINRVAISLCSGYIIMYYGELMFWASPDREGMEAGNIIILWLTYSLLAYPFLCVVSLFRVRSPWAVFLAGAFFGWFEEGIVVQTMYGQQDGPFPESISFTGLAWHAMIDIWIGWYLLRRVLTQNHYLKTIACASAIGLFYGFWGIFWWNEPPPQMSLLLEANQKDLLLIHFVTFAFATTAPLVLAYWLYNRVCDTEFRPSYVELWILGSLVLLYFTFVTVPSAPKALWVLPPLIGVTFWALSRNRRAETRPDAIVAFPDEMKPLNLLLLFMVPLVASAIYFLALANNLRLCTNMIIYYITTPLGALLWLVSVVMCFRPARDLGVRG